MTTGVVTIEEWSVTPVVSSPYQDPATARILRCRGIVYGHPRLADGSEIMTSMICEIDSITGLLITSSRVYKLGNMSAKYEKFRKRNHCKENVYYKDPNFLGIRHKGDSNYWKNDDGSFLF